MASVSGTVSKFANGAMMVAFLRMFNSEAENLVSMSKKGYDSYCSI